MSRAEHRRPPFKAQALHAVGVRAVEADAAAAPSHEMFCQGEIRPALAVAR